MPGVHPRCGSRADAARRPSTPDGGAQCFGGTRQHRGLTVIPILGCDPGQPFQTAACRGSSTTYVSCRASFSNSLARSGDGAATNQFPTTTTHIRGRPIHRGNLRGQAPSPARATPDRFRRGIQGPNPETNRVALFPSRQRRKQVDDVFGCEVPIANIFCCLRIEAPGEHGQTGPELLFDGTAQFVAPTDAQAQRLLSRRRSSTAAGQQRVSVRQPLEDLFRRHRLQARGANSIANGSPSTLEQILLTMALFAPVSSKPGKAATARAANGPSASGVVSGDSRSTASPPMPSASRLVARIRKSGHTRSSNSASFAAVSMPTRAGAVTHDLALCDRPPGAPATQSGAPAVFRPTPARASLPQKQLTIAGVGM